MEEFLRYLIEKIIGPVEGVELTQTQTSQKILFRLKLPQSEVGKFIGKQGRTVEAIRNLLAAAAARQDQRALLQIIEE